MSKMQPLSWDLPHFVTWHDTRMQHVSQKETALLRSRRMLREILE